MRFTHRDRPLRYGERSDNRTLKVENHDTKTRCRAKYDNEVEPCVLVRQDSDAPGEKKLDHGCPMIQLLSFTSYFQPHLQSAPLKSEHTMKNIIVICTHRQCRICHVGSANVVIQFSNSPVEKTVETLNSIQRERRATHPMSRCGDTQGHLGRVNVQCGIGGVIDLGPK